MTHELAGLAGGELLLLIKEKFFEIFNNNKRTVSSERFKERSESKGSKQSTRIRSLVKETLFENLLFTDSVTWRKYLPASMTLADKLLDEQREGLRRANYRVVDIHFFVKEGSFGLTGVGSGLFKAMFEVGLQIDWVLGLPYYAGSTIKGAIVDGLESIVDGNRGDGSGDEAVIDVVLGSTGSASAFLVSDAYPVGCVSESPCLVLSGDVITPHYYSGGRVVEAEYEAKPTPIQHLAIAPGTVFRVLAAVRPLSVDSMEALRVLLNRRLGVSVGSVELALGLLVVRAILDGFGARTGKGYNVFGPCSRECLENLSRNIYYIKIFNEIKPAGLGGQGEEPGGSGS